VNHHPLVRLLHRFTPASTAQWAVTACVLGLVAALYLRSLAVAYAGCREHLPLRRTAIAATALAALSWPASLLLMRVIQSPPVLRPTRRPLLRRLWVAAALVASALGVCAIFNWHTALGAGFLVALGLCSALGAAVLASLAIMAAIAEYVDTIQGVVAWGVIALGMLVFVMWNERRVMTPARRTQAPGGM
jgi:hypothetical protein